MSLAIAIKQNIELLLTLNDDFKNDLILVRKKLLPLEKEAFSPIKMISRYEIDYDDQIKYYRATQKHAIRIRKKYNLSPVYQDNIVWFLGDNKIYQLGREMKWKYMPFKASNPRNPKEKIVVMPLFPESNITDIKKYWKDISNRKNNLYFEIYKTVKNKKIVTRKNFKRDIEIYKFQQSGDKAKEVTKKINKKYPNAKIQYQDVSKIIQRLKNLAGQLVKGN